VCIVRRCVRAAIIVVARPFATHYFAVFVLPNVWEIATFPVVDRNLSRVTSPNRVGSSHISVAVCIVRRCVRAAIIVVARPFATHYFAVFVLPNVWEIATFPVVDRNLSRVTSPNRVGSSHISVAFAKHPGGLVAAHVFVVIVPEVCEGATVAVD